MSRFLLPRLSAVAPYVPGEQPQDLDTYVKINTNECPYPPSPRVLEALDGESARRLNLYPDPTCDELNRALAALYGLKKGQVYVGNGSDEVLAFAFMAFCDEAHGCMFPEISYGFYPVYARLFASPAREVPLNRDFTLPVEPFIGVGRTIFIANPNAPTGIALPLKDIERIVRGNPQNVVVIDEAYIDFGGESARGLIDRYDNLLIVGTFSKSRQLAGGRLGYALANEALIADLNRIKFSFHPYNISRLTLAAAVMAVRDTEYFAACVEKIKKTRARVASALAEMGFEMTDSKANFLFVKPPVGTGEQYYRALKEKKVLVRHFPDPRICDYARVTIGSDGQMDIFLEKTREYLREAGA